MCESIDEAAAINRTQDQNKQPRFRIVTVKGELIETQGTISGGGKPRRGGMSAERIIEFTQ